MRNQNDHKQAILNRMIDTALKINQLGDAVTIAIRLGDDKSREALRYEIEALRMDYEDYAENLETVNREIEKSEQILNEVING